MTTDSKVTFIVDNQAPCHLKKEHGLAILIEHHGLRILFDSGSGGALFDNAKQLKQPLNNIDILIISHGHYDHTENIAWLLANNPNAKLYVHPRALEKRYSKNADKPLRVISISDINKHAILEFPQEQVYYQTGGIEITNGLILSGQIPRTSSEDTGGDFYLDILCLFPDNIIDEQCLWLRKGNEIHIISGCCHAGLINTIQWTIEKNPTEEIASFAGGLHLSNASPERVNASIAALRKFSLKTLYPAHCTGEIVSQKLAEALSPVTEVTPVQSGLTYSL